MLLGEEAVAKIIRLLAKKENFYASVLAYGNKLGEWVQFLEPIV